MRSGSGAQYGAGNPFLCRGRHRGRNGDQGKHRLALSNWGPNWLLRGLLVVENSFVRLTTVVIGTVSLEFFIEERNPGVVRNWGLAWWLDPLP